MDYQLAFRKTALNCGIGLGALFAANIATIIPSNRTALLVSETLIAIAGLAACCTFAWPVYLAYLNGELEGDYEPVTLGELYSAAAAWLRRT